MPRGENLGGQASEEVVLKACPFCGGDWLEIDTCFVHCRSCCTDGPVMDDVPEGSEEDESGASWNAAIARKWNTRADEQQAATIAERDERIGALETALRRILTMRPAGDVSTATNTRALVQQMECIARATLERTKQP
jgi:hypothetical protein